MIHTVANRPKYLKRKGLSETFTFEKYLVLSTFRFSQYGSKSFNGAGHVSRIHSERSAVALTQWVPADGR